MADHLMLGSFHSVDDATVAYNRLLEDHDITNDDISVITTEDVRKDFDTKVEHETDDDLGVVEGAVGGAVTGGLIGLLVSAVPIAIAGLPSLIVVGPIAAALGLGGVAATTTTGATTGAVVGGLIGALDNIGIKEEDAKVYETTVREGGVLLAVATKDEDHDKVKDILSQSGAENIRMGHLR